LLLCFCHSDLLSCIPVQLCQAAFTASSARSKVAMLPAGTSQGYANERSTSSDNSMVAVTGQQRGSPTHFVFI
jgi:hypothetical protein